MNNLSLRTVRARKLHKLVPNRLRNRFDDRNYSST